MQVDRFGLRISYMNSINWNIPNTLGPNFRVLYLSAIVTVEAKIGVYKSIAHKSSKINIQITQVPKCIQ